MFLHLRKYLLTVFSDQPLQHLLSYQYDRNIFRNASHVTVYAAAGTTAGVGAGEGLGAGDASLSLAIETSIVFPTE